MNQFYRWISTINDWVMGHIFNQNPDRSAGNNMRRFASRVSLIVVCACVFDAIFTTLSQSDALLMSDAYMSWLITGWSLLFFGVNVVSIPLMTDESWRPNAARLLIDIFTSMAITILGFGLLFIQTGIVNNMDADMPPTIRDHFYFAAVTFSTLGYGDFAPMAQARPYAAALALIGNLHLGMTVAALFYSTQTTPRAKDGVKRGAGSRRSSLRRWRPKR